jgi:hypothetical protein
MHRAIALFAPQLPGEKPTSARPALARDSRSRVASRLSTTPDFVEIDKIMPTTTQQNAARGCWALSI